MTPLDMFQLFLLSQMRAKNRVRDALKQLGYGIDALRDAASAAQVAGLEQPGHSITIYSQLLGEPIVEAWVESSDPYSRRCQQYQLPLWAPLLLTVVGNEQGQTGGMFFIGEHQVSIPIHQSDDLKPWKQTESQLAELLSDARLQDEWYPQKDYACTRLGTTVGDFVLRFDFGLLQQVSAYSDLEGGCGGKPFH